MDEDEYDEDSSDDMDPQDPAEKDFKSQEYSAKIKNSAVKSLARK